MLKKILGALILIMAWLSVGSMVLASSWLYRFPTTITDTGTVARTNLPVLLGYGGASLVSSGKMSSSGLDTNMQIGATNIKYMMGTSQVVALIPTLPASGNQRADLYTEYSPAQTGFPIMTGQGGYIRTNYNAAIEPGNDFVIEASGLFDTANATGKYIVNKTASPSGTPDAYAGINWYVSPTNSGNITAEIWTDSGATANITASNQSLSEHVANGLETRAGEYLNAFPYFHGKLTQVDLYLAKTGLPTGTANVTVRNSADVLLGIIGTIDVATLTDPAFAWYSFNSTAIDVPAPNDIRILFEYDGGGVADYVNVGSINPRDTTDSEMTVYAGTYTDYNTWNITHRFYYQVPAVAKTISIGGLPATVSNLKLIEDGAGFWMNVDGNLSNNETALAVPDNEQHYFLMQGDVDIYQDYFKLTTSGVPRITYQPATMISGTTLLNIVTGGIYSGIIYFGSNAGMTLTYGEMESYNPTSAAVAQTGGFALSNSIMPSTWFTSGANIPNLPFYDSFNSVALNIGMPIQTLYFIIAIGMCFLAFMIVTSFTRSALLGVLSLDIVLFISSSMTIVPMWIPFVIMIVQLGIMFLYRQVAY